MLHLYRKQSIYIPYNVQKNKSNYWRRHQWLSRWRACLLSQQTMYESCWRQNSSWLQTVFHCTRPFTHPQSDYDWNTVEGFLITKDYQNTNAKYWSPIYTYFTRTFENCHWTAEALIRRLFDMHTSPASFLSVPWRYNPCPSKDHKWADCYMNQCIQQHIWTPYGPKSKSWQGQSNSWLYM